MQSGPVAGQPWISQVPDWTDVRDLRLRDMRDMRDMRDIQRFSATWLCSSRPATELRLSHTAACADTRRPLPAH